MSPATIANPCPERPLDAEEPVDDLTRLYRLAWSLCGSRALAEEVAEETYVRVLSRPRRVRAGGGFPYLARTVRDVLHEHRRSERRHPPLPRLSPRSDPEPATFASEVYAAVADLPEPLRNVVAAVDVAEMSHDEAARSLRIPVATVMSRLRRGRSRLACVVAA